jgi:CubicO group peptidase (beta-lactamase class C family)
MRPITRAALLGAARNAALPLLALLVASAPLFAQGPAPKSPAAKKPSSATAPAAAPAPAPETGAPQLTAADVAAFLDGLVPAQLGPGDVGGAVVVVVKDGKVLYGSGYGFSDVEKRTPVNWETTLFRPGSISKLFTWTAVMQQVEQGKLDLDTDVNKYIDFQVPEAFGKPITLRDVMTHTPGYEDYAKDLIVGDPKMLGTLGAHLKSHQPHRIFPPGSTPAYSNYATAMAGYIVERVSGKPFAEYIQENILGPLGMKHATFQQPLPAELEPLMSKGYKVASEKARPFEIVVPAPAGSLSAAGADMARFMIAHLQDGQYEGAQILKPETAKLMHSRQRGKSPETDGMCLGFYEESRNGHRIIGHGGDTNWFHSDLHLLPDANLGFFVSYNSGGNGKGSGRTLLWEKFLDRYFPYTPPAVTRSADAKTQAQKVSGNYLVSRREDTHFLRLLYLLEQTKVYPSPTDEGAIEISALTDFNQKPKAWEPIGNGVFREVHGQEKVVFQKDPLGRDELVTEYPFFDFFRPPAHLDAKLFLPAAIVTLVVLVLAVVLWPVGGWVRRHYGRRLDLPPGERRLRLWTRLVCLVDVALIAGFAVVIIKGLEDLDLLTPKTDPILHVFQAMAALALIGTLIALVNAVIAWGSRQRGIWSKLGETLIFLATVGLAWVILAGRLLHVGPSY